MKKVKKFWGEEYWIINTDKYCGKLLKLNKGFQCSLHAHLAKDETFYVIEGKVLMELEGNFREMVKGDSQRILPKQFHRFRGLTDAEIIEFSTHHEDADTVRREISKEV